MADPGIIVVKLPKGLTRAERALCRAAGQGAINGVVAEWAAQQAGLEPTLPQLRALPMATAITQRVDQPDPADENDDQRQQQHDPWRHEDSLSGRARDGVGRVGLA